MAAEMLGDVADNPAGTQPHATLIRVFMKEAV